MNYDNLKLKDYENRIEQEDDSIKYILSFNERQHMKVSEKAKFLMDCFNGQRTLEHIIEELKQHEIEVSKAELEKFVNEVLVPNSVLEGANYDKKSKGNSYMWCRLPVIDSNKLAGLFHLLKYLFNKLSVILILTCISFCVIWSITQFIQMRELNIKVNSLLFVLLSYFSLVLHEFGHISAAYKMGIKVGYIGVGMYFFNPVFFVDMTNAWRLDNKKRVIVDMGGIYFQLIIIIPLTMIAIITEHHFLYAINVFIVALTLTNLIPFIKLDGYWMLCDYLELSNVSSNAFKIIVHYMVQKVKTRKDAKQIGKKQKAYIIFSFVYLGSTLFMLSFGLYLAIQAILKKDQVVLQIESMVDFFASSDFSNGFVMLNEIFIFILPVLFIILIVTKVIYGFTKGILKNIKGKVKIRKVGVNND